MHKQFPHPLLSPTPRGVHHLALCTDNMKATIDFYVEVLGMPLVHAMKVPPGLGTGPSNRGNPPYERVRHYFFLITHYLQPSSHGTKQEHTAVSAGLNDGAQQGAISKGAQRGPVCCSLRNRGSVPGGGDALALAIRLCLPGLRRAASQLRQDTGALPVYRLPAADIRDRRNDFRSNQGAAVHLVSRHVPPHSEQGRHLQH